MMQTYLLRILTLPVELFLLAVIGTILLNLRLFRMRVLLDKHLPAYKTLLVDTLSLGLYRRA